MENINPILLATTGFTYKIIICGNKLPSLYNGLFDYKEKNIIYAGFVEDINLYFKGCDIFINPVVNGGGIKTKLVEALGYDLSVTSTKTGAIGIPVEMTGNKMKISEDNDWKAFTDNIINLQTAIHTPAAFFDQFYWDNIAQKAAGILNFNSLQLWLLEMA
ncbi:MAG: glycosyltransferase family 4 protein [Chitinophagaceae bacterium]|nr:glycosyltransferase family 4 protein [Chitinophagaceae bacterium]